MKGFQKREKRFFLSDKCPCPYYNSYHTVLQYYYTVLHIYKDNYNDILEEFGSDDMYDFTKECIFLIPSSLQNNLLISMQRSPKDYMGQFGSDNYLYDFAKKRNLGFG